MSLTVGLEEEDGEVMGAIGCVNFIETITIDVDFPIAVPSPLGFLVGVFSGTLAIVDFLFFTVAEFGAIW